MKTTLRHYGPVAGLLAVIVAVSALLTLWLGDTPRQAERPRVLAITYPLYVAAQQVIGDTDGVELSLLSGTGAGCLHDYQLTPADRLALSQADLVLANGLGAEPFLEGVVESARLVDTAAGVQPLCTTHHHEGEDHHHESESYNEHVWVSPTQYEKQVAVVTRALRAVDPQNSALYTQNARQYLSAVRQVADALPDLTGRPCVLFHDSLSYLAEDLGLDVKLTLSAEGDSGQSAAQLAQVARLAAQHPDLILLYDTQYPVRYTSLQGVVPAGQILALDTAVVGAGKPTDWLDAMQKNAEKLQKLTGGDTP